MTVNGFFRVSFFIIALALSVSTLLFEIFEGRTKKRQNIIFLFLLSDLALTAIVSIPIYGFIEQVPYDTTLRLIYDISQFLYFLLHSLLAPLFCLYVLEVTGAYYRQTVVARIVLALPCAVGEFFVLINPMTHYVYETNADMVFTRGWAEYLIYLIAAFYFVLSVIYLLFSWYAINFRRRWALLYSFGIALLGVLIQLLFSGLSVELAFESIAFLGMLLHCEREDDRLDATVNVYNRNALRLDARNYIRMGREFYALCVRVMDSDILQRITGSADTDALLRVVARELSRVFPSHHIYRVSPASFMLIGVDTTFPRMKNVASTILDRFTRPFDYREIRPHLNATLLMVSVPGEVSEDDMMLLADGELPAGTAGQLLEGESLSFLRRSLEVEEALTRGISEYTIETYYKPVYDWRNRAIFAAEAVLSLKDQKLGTLWEEELFPVALESGDLDTLEDIRVREIMLFLGSGLPTELGLTHIIISIPAAQCVQPTFLNNIRERISRYNVEPSKFIIALKDISMIQDRDVFGDALRELHKMGFLIMLDQYGVGDSGIHALDFYPYNVVAIAMNSIRNTAGREVRREILQNNIKMLNDLGFQILVKGVSVEPQLRALEETDIDYVEGPLFSNPINQQEFLTILRATDLSRQEEKKARAQSEAKSSFLANMSHEIRTPINAILGMNEMILRECNDDTIRSYAYDIERAGVNLLSLINDILDFSKIEAGSMEIVEVEYELSSLLHDVINMIRIKTDGKGLKLLLDMDPNIPEKLFGDEVRIRQILVNLLNNAVKYTEKGSVSLKVRGGYAEGSNVLLTFVVSDTGRGIREEDQSALFDKFKRMDEAANRNVEGTGLGLSITANLIQLMNGSIDVQSIYGTGSTFTVTLTQRVIRWDPIGDIEKRYRDSEKNRPKEESVFTAPDARILVVDDTSINLTVVKALLKRTLIKVDTAGSGKECLKKIRETAYDCIFLDYRMPEMDGSETLLHMKKEKDHLNTNTPVIVLTANAITGAKERFLEEGFDEYLSKPIDTEKMEKLLQRFLPAEKLKAGSAGGRREEVRR